MLQSIVYYSSENINFSNTANFNVINECLSLSGSIRTPGVNLVERSWENVSLTNPIHADLAIKWNKDQTKYIPMSVAELMALITIPFSPEQKDSATLYPKK